jgi:hypothetical protein
MVQSRLHQNTMHLNRLSAAVAAAASVAAADACQMPEFHQRVSVLQQLGYVSPDGTVTLKGRAACEINSTQVGVGCVCGGGMGVGVGSARVAGSPFSTHCQKSTQQCIHTITSTPLEPAHHNSPHLTWGKS